MVAGLISAELYKIAAGCQDIEKYRNTFMNLALPVYSFSEPMPAPKVNLFSMYHSLRFIDSFTEELVCTNFYHFRTHIAEINTGHFGIDSILMDVRLMEAK